MASENMAVFLRICHNSFKTGRPKFHLMFLRWFQLFIVVFNLLFFYSRVVKAYLTDSALHIFVTLLGRTVLGSSRMTEGPFLLFLFHASMNAKDNDWIENNGQGFFIIDGKLTCLLYL